MKAAVLEGTRNMVCKDVEKPVPAKGEVLIRVAYCGVCGSDVPRFLDGTVHGFPIILGHEFSGQIEEVGPEVDPALVGTRVSCIPLKPCMNCVDCEEGNYSLCKHYGFIGSRQNGAYAEYVALPVQNIYPISDDVTDLEGAFFEPASVAQHAVDLIAPSAPAKAAVLGCGTVGTFTAQILQAMGLDVYAFEINEKRILAARSAGIENIVDTSEDGWDEKIKAALPRGGFDYIFDTSGNGMMMVKSFDLAANKSTVCMVGTPKRPIEFTVREWENLNRKEMTVTGTWMSYSAPFPGKEWDEVAAGFAQGYLKVTDEMIDDIYTLDEIPVGMERFGIPNSISGKLLMKCR